MVGFPGNKLRAEIAPAIAEFDRRHKRKEDE
jgi:hypothetical protein